ncbi:hypothetical protein EVAR_40145_1 [Eumeta japonica]|uniref:Uncharacterized protein n=1 Tax=Eumeta variegata TaxID=151549 RepID=A0A4C1YIZ9_EUMVA|nr:hypothetical protein EVAR_40145_1 [Eumeta japonica]
MKPLRLHSYITINTQALVCYLRRQTSTLYHLTRRVTMSMVYANKGNINVDSRKRAKNDRVGNKMLTRLKKLTYSHKNVSPFDHPLWRCSQDSFPIAPITTAPSPYHKVRPTSTVILDVHRTSQFVGRVSIAPEQESVP